MKKKSLIKLLSKFCFFLVVISASNSCKEETKEILVLGQKYQGGIIVYLDDSGEHGIIAATTDQHTSIQWCLGSCLSTNAFSTAYKSGKTNTDLIVTVQKTGNYAASICSEMVHNGYDDWVLPSKDELNSIFIQKEAGRIENFLAEDYWSSTESNSDSDRAWKQHLGNGSIHAEIKQNYGCVRAVRYF